MNFKFEILNFKLILLAAVCFLIIFLFLFLVYEVYIPKSWHHVPPVVYEAKKGSGDDEISIDLQNRGIIKNNWFFRFYVIISGRHAKLQAGDYDVSSSMSVAQIANKMVAGDVVKGNIVIFDGMSAKDISQMLEKRGISKADEFLEAAKKDYSKEFYFLADKPKDASLEGYLFPDTYQISAQKDPEILIKNMLANFGKKLTPDMREEIKKQNKTIFQIITMASIIEKEVRTLDDKKIIAGILWKRIEGGMPMQVDSTINYITNKNDPGVSIKDTKIDSPYNTYKNKGLPPGPISNPGINSILAAIYPKVSPYWFYLSAHGTGQTIFSKTFGQHNIAKAEYLGD